MIRSQLLTRAAERVARPLAGHQLLRGSDTGSTTEEASPEEEMPEEKEKGPYSEENDVKGSAKDSARNSYAVFQFKDKFYQWKWNNDSMHWYFFKKKDHHTVDGSSSIVTGLRAQGLGMRRFKGHGAFRSLSSKPLQSQLKKRSQNPRAQP